MDKRNSHIDELLTEMNFFAKSYFVIIQRENGHDKCY